MTSWMVAAVFVGVVVLVAAVIWWVPRAQVRRWRRIGISSEEKLAELTVQARTGITQALGGLALVATLALTAYQVNETRRSSDDNLRLAEQGQVSERFSRAVEQLGATNESGGPAIDVRAGALFSLLRIGLDSEKQAEPAFRVVATYVTNNYELPKNLARRPVCKSFHVPEPDIATALTSVLPVVAEKLLKDAGEPTILGLRGTNLSGLGLDGLVLKRFDLTQIKLRDTNLKDADFSKSTLVEAKLDRACLRNADLRGADLRRAILVDADLSNAQLDGANLRGANLRDARFTERALDHASLSKAQREVIIVSS